jgi:hypothetical protein
MARLQGQVIGVRVVRGGVLNLGNVRRSIFGFRFSDFGFRKIVRVYACGQIGMGVLRRKDERGFWVSNVM